MNGSLMNMHVNEKKSTVVKPAQDTPKRCLWLSNLDLLARRSHIWVVYLYRFDGSSNFFDLGVLKDALSEALVTFYPLAGRLKTGDEDGRIHVDCNGAGAVLVEAATDSALDDLGDFTPSIQLMKLFPTAFDYTHDISSCPILLAQVTHFKCGGVSIGIGIHHTVVDGASSMDFINYWSTVARGLHPSVPPHPFMDRRVLQARNPPTPLFDHVEYQLPPISPQAPPDESSQAADPLVSKLKISPHHLNLLKSKFQDDDTNGVRYSTFEIVASHVWRCLCKARNLPQDELTTIYIPTSGRTRLRPPLPPAFFGSAVFIAAAVATVGDLLSGSGTIATARIHEALARMDDEYLRSALDYLELQPDLSLMFRRSETCRFANVGFVSWATLPLYDADFGWGRPVYVGPPKVLYEGQAYVIPSPPGPGDDGKGSLYLLISLQKQQMESFLHYFYHGI